MSYSFQDPVKRFDGYVPTSFLEDTLRTLNQCYQRAYELAKKLYPWQVAHDYRPYLRRAEFEKEWPLVVQKYSELGAHCEYCQNYARNCWHALVTFGGVLLTQSLVDQKLKAVRRAMFRDGYARRNESFLFADMAPPAPMADAPLYAILSHEGTPDQARPLYADIIFPDPQGEIVARIELVKRFPDLFTTGKPIAEEVVADALDIGLRKDIKEERKSV